jgi:hypothetical protein
VYQGLRRFAYSCNEWNEDAKYSLGLALRLIKFQLRHGNDLQVLELLRDFPGSILEQGNLLLQNNFVVVDAKKRKHDRRVFLFEAMIIFTREYTEGVSTVYRFRSDLKTNEMGLTATIASQPKSFLIWFRKQTVKTTLTMQAESEEVKNEWIQEINYILYEQAVRLKERYGAAVVDAATRVSTLNNQQSPRTVMQPSAKLKTLTGHT